LSINDPKVAKPDPATVGTFTFQIRDRKISSRAATGGDVRRRIETRASAAAD
jgi:hypothetical protein